MSEYTDAKDAKAGKEPKAAKKGFSVQRVEGLQGLQDLLNSTEGGKVDSWQRVGEGATFICVLSGVPMPEAVEATAEPVEPVAEPVAEEKEHQKRKSA